MAKFVVAEKTSEYNDEYYTLSNGYNIVSKLYNTEEEAKTQGRREAILQLFIDWKGNFNSENFDFKKFGEDSECAELCRHFDKKGWKYDKEDYELYLPKDLTEDEVVEAYNLWDTELFKIIKIEE